MSRCLLIVLSLLLSASLTADLVTPASAQWHGGGHGWSPHGNPGHGYWGHGYSHQGGLGGFWGPGGFIGGVLGGWVAGQMNRPAEPAPVEIVPWTRAWYDYCSKYKSFDPQSGYYTTYEGEKRFCR